MTDFKAVSMPTEVEATEIETLHPGCEWVQVKEADAIMYFAFKPFSQQVYYSAIDLYNALKSVSERNFAMTTGHLINGLDTYQSNDKVRIALDLYAQSMLDDVQVSFKKKPTFTA